MVGCIIIHIKWRVIYTIIWYGVVVYYMEASILRVFKAFSLIEILVVIAIVGIIAVVGFSAYKDYRNKATVGGAVLVM